jgi:putative ABC transport system permease protein
MLMKIATIALRNIFRNKRRSLLSLTAIAVAAMVIVFMFALIEGMKNDQKTTVIEYTTGEAEVADPEYEKYATSYPLQFGIPDYPAADKALSTVPQVRYNAPRIQFKLEIGVNGQALKFGDKVRYIFSDTRVAVGLGLDIDTEKDRLNLAHYLLPGGKLPGPDQVLVGAALADKLGVKEGDKLTVFYSTAADESHDALLTVSGRVALPLAQYSERVLLLPLATAQDLLGLGKGVLQVLIFFRDDNLASNVASVKAALGAAGLSDLAVTPWTEIGSMASYLKLAEISIDFIALFFFIIGTTVIINTTMMVIYERMREIGTLGAMGMKGRELVILFFFEALFLSAAASLAGVILGALIVLPLGINGFDFGKLVDLGKTGLSISNVIYPQLDVQSTLFVFIYSTAIASLVSFIPSRRASKIEPVEALRAL